MKSSKSSVSLTSRDRKILESWIDKPGVPIRRIIRAWIVLLSAAGHPTDNIASRLGVSVSTVLYWRNRFRTGGVSDLSDERSVSRKHRTTEEVRRIVEATRMQFPDKARRWSIRNMAQATGISRSTIQRIWKSYGLRPHRADSFKFFHDERFYAKCSDIVGLYMTSPQTFVIALWSSDSSKKSIRTDAGAAPLDGSAISAVLRKLGKSRAAVLLHKPDLLDFLKWVDSHTPSDSIVHLIVSRQTLALYPHSFRWLKRRTRFQQHMLPEDRPPARFIEDWYIDTCKVAGSERFSSLVVLDKAMRDFCAADSGPLSSLRRVQLAQPFFWVRPDRNYLVDRRQPELQLTIS